MKVRLNKYLSECGIASRRKADELIIARKVKVNGRIIKEPGVFIDLQKDIVFINNRKASAEKKRYIILNKPRLFLTTLVNKEDKKPTIVDLIKNINERVYPVGRLDYDSEGLLFLTNDGELANRIHHPRYEVKKTYNTTIKSLINDKMVKKIKDGTKLDGKFIKPDSVKITHLKNGSSKVVITFHEGKRHLVKNYLRYFGFRVERLRRTQIGNLKLGKLPCGSWRDLTDRELKLLRYKTGLV